MTDQRCQKWFVKLRAGDFSLDDASWSDRSVEVDGDQIETVIENHQHYTTGELANILKISKSIVIGKTETCVFCFTEKPYGLFGQPSIPLIPSKYFTVPVRWVVHFQDK